MKKFTSLCLAVTGVLLTQVVYADSAKLLNPANGHSYQRFDTKKTWTQAKDACAKLGAHLATITDQAENDWIVRLKIWQQNKPNIFVKKVYDRAGLDTYLTT